MSAGRFGIALLLAVTLAGQALGQVPFDAAGQIFLTFDLGFDRTPPGPRFGLRLGRQGAPIPDRHLDRAVPGNISFDNAVSFSFDALGQAHVTLGDVRLPFSTGFATGHDYDDVATHYASPGTALPAPRGASEPAPLVTAAGPTMPADQAEAAVANAGRRPFATSHAADRGGSGWSFRKVTTASEAAAPRKHRLMASVLHRSAGAMAPAASQDGRSRSPRPQSQVADTQRWQFKPLVPGASVNLAAKTTGPTTMGTPLASQMALLLKPHSRVPQQNADHIAIGGGDRANGPWVFRQLATAKG